MKENGEEEEIGMEELKEIVVKLKNGKAPGYDKITTEMIKNMGEKGGEMLLDIYNRIWTEEIVPKEWQISLIVPIYKNDIVIITEA